MLRLKGPKQLLSGTDDSDSSGTSSSTCTELKRRLLARKKLMMI
jgi:hypothetical protein